ncbi:Meiosis-specific serine/threonine-protein kinase mek1 [Lachnellula suecica]|uniref:Meiosis-specific serine/threonine-protein kinase mek1 n=1 Tax=Lachnellula suecica TaxID=602035 RepID=A0A8T9BZI3_9HELO|nr:Meiosis-specific serine/threonine-protein kinase mek1 [Lachnellula suecica]
MLEESLPILTPPREIDEDIDLCDSIAFLEVIDEQRGETYEISIYPGREIRVGRDDSKCAHLQRNSNYTLSDIRISKQHFRIYSIIYEEGQTEFPPLVYCEDLESSNGTYVNDALIGIICQEKRGFLLNDGDIIEIRPSWKFTFHQNVHETVYRDAAELSDLQFFQDKFSVSDRILGKGTYGAVYLATEAATLNQVACKIVNLTSCADKHMEHRSYAKAGNLYHNQLVRAAEGRKVAMREINILSQLSHPHIINLKKAFVTSTSLYMFTELAPGGDLFSYLESHGGHLDDWHGRLISRQIALAIEHLHSKGIAHRDIKPENVLITQTNYGGRVMLTDFGFANFADVKTGRMESLVGTAGFVAPEVESEELRKKGYTSAADLWSLGVLTACILTGTSIIPKKELSQLSQLEIADRFLGVSDSYARAKWVSMAPRAQRFLRKLLTADAAKRMTATEALDHPWLKKPLSEGKLLEEGCGKIIRFWKKREGGGDPVIEKLRSSPEAEQERLGPKFRRKLPDASSSPYFSLDRHLLQKGTSSRKDVLASLVESGSQFVSSTDSPKNADTSKFSRTSRGVNIVSVNGNDLFGKIQEMKRCLDADLNVPEDLFDNDDDDEMVLVPTEPVLHLDRLDLESPIKSLRSEVEDSPAVPEDEAEDRASKRARKESWDPEDRKIHETVAKELPRYTSAKVFRDAIKRKKQVDQKENVLYVRLI